MPVRKRAGAQLRSLFGELNRRKLYPAAAFYAASAWLLVQVATQIAPFFGLPAWSVRLIIVAVIVGFPPAMLIAWFYDWAPAKPLPVVSPDRSGARAASPLADAKSIAVLPFADMSEGKDQEYFSDGLAEELLNLLAQLPQLRVIARTSPPF